MSERRLGIIPVLATGLGFGWSPIASGTVGALWGVVIVVAMAPLALGWQIALACALSLIAIPLCDAAEEHFGRKDDGRIVADEFLTFPLCVLGLPWQEHPWLLGAAFVMNRIMDIIKPPPARQAQNLHGGLGIVVDDVVSSLYALVLNHLAWWAWVRWVMGNVGNG